MKKPVRIFVRRRHIDNGEPGFTDRCAVALAVKESTKSVSVCVSGSGYIETVKRRHTPPVSFSYPSYVDRFIDRFDQIDPYEEVDAKLLRRKMKPFSFLMKEDV